MHTHKHNTDENPNIHAYITTV